MTPTETPTTTVQTTETPTSITTGTDNGHQFLFLLMGICGIVLILGGCVLSTGLWGDADVTRWFEYGLVFLTGAGLLKAKSS